MGFISTLFKNPDNVPAKDTFSNSGTSNYEVTYPSGYDDWIEIGTATGVMMGSTVQTNDDDIILEFSSGQYTLRSSGYAIQRASGGQTFNERGELKSYGTAGDTAKSPSDGTEGGSGGAGGSGGQPTP